MFLLGSQIAASHLVVLTRTTGVHHQGAFCGQNVLAGEVDRIGPSGNFSDGADRGMEHDPIGLLKAEAAKAIRQFLC